MPTQYASEAQSFSSDLHSPNLGGYMYTTYSADGHVLMNPDVGGE